MGQIIEKIEIFAHFINMVAPHGPNNRKNEIFASYIDRSRYLDFGKNFRHCVGR